MCKSAKIRNAVFFSAAALLGAGVGGCTLVDQFGGRASDYNFQTANARNATILGNIVRAAYSLPLEFTDVTTLAGTASAGATMSATVPVPTNHAGAIAAQSVGLMPSGTASASNTVNVANLATQEFYQGLQTPLTMQQVAYYLTMRFGGLSPSELLPLLISDIELRSPDGKTATLYNSADDPVAFNRFYSALNALISLGLTVEQVTKKAATTVGPELTATEASDPRLLASIVSAAAGGSSGSSSNSGSSGSGGGSTPGNSNNGLTLVQLKKTGPDNKPMFQFQKGGVGGSGNYRFCFAHVDPQRYSDVNFTIRSQPIANTMTIPLGKAYRKPLPTFTVTIGSKYYCGAESPPLGSTTGKQNAAEGISITTRSLEGIFQYLGEIVRTELGIANGQPTSLAIPRNQEEADRGQGFHLFRLYRRAPSLAEPWVLYDGHVYTIAVDPSGQADASSRVLQLVSDLLALQSSAKALPAPNLIAITTP
jgi:hypothetical protein